MVLMERYIPRSLTSLLLQNHFWPKRLGGTQRDYALLSTVPNVLSESPKNFSEKAAIKGVVEPLWTMEMLRRHKRGKEARWPK